MKVLACQLHLNLEETSSGTNFIAWCINISASCAIEWDDIPLHIPKVHFNNVELPP
jgi:hypothetical protein